MQQYAISFHCPLAILVYGSLLSVKDADEVRACSLKIAAQWHGVIAACLLLEKHALSSKAPP